jgi:hypothetical protein
VSGFYPKWIALDENLQRLAIGIQGLLLIAG